MNSLTHPSEEIMALVDGELTAAEASVVQAHIDECVECSALVAELRGTSQALHAWALPEFSAEAVRGVEEKIEAADAKSRELKPRRYTPLSFRNWRLWAIGGGGAAAVVLALVIAVAIAIDRPQYFVSEMRSTSEPAQDKAVSILADSAPIETASADHRSVATAAGGGRAVSQRVEAGVAGQESMPLSASVASLAQIQPGVSGGTAQAHAASAPMIARSVAMTVLVKNVEDARRDLDGILGKHGGYAAQLTLNTPENGARSFQSSLRIPAEELTVALDELRRLGRVQTETQSGEEVTQQHTDLVARLTNARETETRLRAILQQRTGKMEDVLDVEEKISETRGEIEQMEAEQKALEHRVAFASIELQLTERYKAQLGAGAQQSVGTEMHNALVNGLRNAGGSLLGLVLFFEEYGPAMVLWTVLLGGPVWLVWRIRRRRNAAS
jgi:anti-sigma factor RsiW